MKKTYHEMQAETDRLVLETCNRVKYSALERYYKFKQWAAVYFDAWRLKTLLKRHIIRFIQDEDGDIGVTLLSGLVSIIKYKDMTIWYFFKSYPDAEKYQGSSTCTILSDEYRREVENISADSSVI